MHDVVITVNIPVLFRRARIFSDCPPCSPKSLEPLTAAVRPTCLLFACLCIRQNFETKTNVATVFSFSAARHERSKRRTQSPHIQIPPGVRWAIFVQVGPLCRDASRRAGFNHSAFTFYMESNLTSSSSNHVIPPGALVTAVQKGLQYVQAEIGINEVDDSKMRQKYN